MEQPNNRSPGGPETRTSQPQQGHAPQYGVWPAYKPVVPQTQAGLTPSGDPYPDWGHAWPADSWQPKLRLAFPQPPQQNQPLCNQLLACCLCPDSQKSHSPAPRAQTSYYLLIHLYITFIYIFSDFL